MWFLAMVFLVDIFNTARVDLVLKNVANFDRDFDGYEENEQTQIIRNEVLPHLLV